MAGKRSENVFPMHKAAGKSAQVYQLKITLRDSRPSIWRRVLVPADITLGKLHSVIQVAMGWDDSHLHQFLIDDEYYSRPDPEELEESIDERRMRLSSVAPPLKRSFLYEYDFGDGWEHTVTVEKVLPREAGRRYPVCLAGSRNCPPEDCGGIYGYMDMLKILANPKHEQYEDMIEWVGEDFDPERFDLEDTNAGLAKLR